MSGRPDANFRGEILDRVDVVVVGGGITGQCTAAAASTRGMRVALIEKEAGPAVEGSGRAQGSLRLQGRAAAELPLAEEAISLWHEIDHEADIELSFGGNIYLCDDPDELPMLHSLVRTAHEAGLEEVELLEPEQAREVLPCADGPFVAAMWSPRDGKCDPAKATRHIAQVAAGRGVRQHYGLCARRVFERGGRVGGVATDRGRIVADSVVLACGIWTRHLARTVDVKVPVMPLAVSQCETTPSQMRFAPTVRAFGCGCRQRPDGRIVLSAGLNTVVEHRLTLADVHDAPLWLSRLRRNRSSVRLRVDARTVLAQLRHRSALSPELVSNGSYTPRPNTGAMERALAALHGLMSASRDTRIARSWTGMIDMSPDGMPIIDGGAGPDGLAIVTGLSGHGFALGPVLGEIAADLAIDRRTTRPVEPFRLSRFREGPVPVPERMI